MFSDVYVSGSEKKRVCNYRFENGLVLTTNNPTVKRDSKLDRAVGRYVIKEKLKQNKQALESEKVFDDYVLKDVEIENEDGEKEVQKETYAIYLGKPYELEGAVDMRLIDWGLKKNIEFDSEFINMLCDKDEFNGHAKYIKELETGIIKACDNHAGITNFIRTKSNKIINSIDDIDNKDLELGVGYLRFLNEVKRETAKGFSNYMYFCSMYPGNALYKAAKYNLDSIGEGIDFYEKQLSNLLSAHSCKWGNFDPSKSSFTEFAKNFLFRSRSAGVKKEVSSISYDVSMEGKDEENELSLLDLISFERWGESEALDDKRELLQMLFDNCFSEGEKRLIELIAEYNELDQSVKKATKRPDYINQRWKEETGVVSPFSNHMIDNKYSRITIDMKKRATDKEYKSRYINSLTEEQREVFIKLGEDLGKYLTEDLEKSEAYFKRQDEKRVKEWEEQKTKTRARIRQWCDEDILSLYDYLWENRCYVTSNFIKSVCSIENIEEFRCAVKGFIAKMMFESDLKYLISYRDKKYSDEEKRRRFTDQWSYEYLMYKMPDKMRMLMRGEVDNYYKEYNFYGFCSPDYRGEGIKNLMLKKFSSKAKKFYSGVSDYKKEELNYEEEMDHEEEMSFGR